MAGSSKGSLFDGRYRAVTPEIENLVSIIRGTFLATRKQFIPQAPMRASKAAEDHFLQTAFLVQQLGVDAATFTVQQVHAMAETGNIFPNGLHSRKVMQRHATAHDLRSWSLADCTAQFLLFKGLQKLFTGKQAISDPSNSFTPLFRACVALRLGLPEVAQRYRNEALLELPLHPVMRELFPAEVKSL
jgi:hypothetical protein